MPHQPRVPAWGRCPLPAASEAGDFAAAAIQNAARVNPLQRGDGSRCTTRCKPPAAHSCSQFSFSISLISCSPSKGGLSADQTLPVQMGSTALTGAGEKGFSTNVPGTTTGSKCIPALHKRPRNRGQEQRALIHTQTSCEHFPRGGLGALDVALQPVQVFEPLLIIRAFLGVLVSLQQV